MEDSGSFLQSESHAPSSAPKPAADTNTGEKSETLWTMSRHKKVALLCLGLGTIKNYMMLSLLAPFYPVEAQSRGIDEFTSSWVFSVYALTQVITAPLFGRVIPVVGARFLYISGAFVCSTCTILFGFLDMFPQDGGPFVFLTFSFLLRIIMSIGGTAWFTSGFAIAMTTFRENAATVMGLMETAVGVGMVLGPALGGLLYELGGFLLPFLLLGLVVYLFIPLYFYNLTTTTERSEPGSMLTILSTPWAWILVVCIISVAMLLIDLQPILEIHLTDFGLGAAETGLTFLLYSAAYAISATVVGAIVDRITDSRGLLISGFLLIFVAFFFIGPSPYTPLVQYQALWLNFLCVAVLGLASGQALVPTYSLLMIAAQRSGMPDNMSTHGAVSGLFTSAYAMGETLGPIMAGWLAEDYGFAWATTVFAFHALGMAIILVPFIAYDKWCSRDSDVLDPGEKISLLESRSTEKV